MHAPWGTPQTEPTEWPRVCTIPTIEFPKAMPARVAALAMPSRPSLSPGFNVTLRRLSLISLVAANAWASLRGFFARQVYASTACESASMPVAAVAAGGRVSVIRESTTQAFGKRKLLTKAIFRCFS